MNRNVFAQVAGLIHGTVDADECTYFRHRSPLDRVRLDAQIMAKDIVLNNHSKAPNRYCNTLRRTVKQLSDRHDLVFNKMMERLNPDENCAFPEFVVIADTIFDDGHVNWGRIVAVYALAARLSKHYIDNNSHITSESNYRKRVHYQKNIAVFVGKYISNKLGHWIVYNGGWDSFVEYFPVQDEFDKPMWKGVLLTTIVVLTTGFILCHL